VQYLWGNSRRLYTVNNDRAVRHLPHHGDRVPRRGFRVELPRDRVSNWDSHFDNDNINNKYDEHNLNDVDNYDFSIDFFDNLHLHRYLDGAQLHADYSDLYGRIHSREHFDDYVANYYCCGHGNNGSNDD
jgi:hypothetical protein